MLYSETLWKRPHSFEIHEYKINIQRINASKTRIEQQTRIEKISLVAFLDKHQKRKFFNISRALKRIDNKFYQNNNLHVTFFGFGPLSRQVTYKIDKRINEFFKRIKCMELCVSFDTLRLGTMYSGHKNAKPVQISSNGTVIALGEVKHNRDFFILSNKLTTFLLQDKCINLILGKNFRRKFPTVWITLGYFDRSEKFAVNNDLQEFFEKYQSLNKKSFSFRISQINLVKSNYKNLRYKKLISQYSI